MTPSDELSSRVIQLNKELDRIRRENLELLSDRKELRGKKDLKPKKAMSLDKQSVRMIGSHAGAPTLVAGGTMHVLNLILTDVNAQTFMGLTIRGFWHDPQVSGWCVAGLTITFAAVYKFLRRYS